jgi:hypothetical protein
MTYTYLYFAAQAFHVLSPLIVEERAQQVHDLDEVPVDEDFQAAL